MIPATGASRLPVPSSPAAKNGSSDVKAKLLDGGKIIQGFSGVFNVVPQIPLLKNGVLNNTDVYTKDPEGWYVQFYIDVLDDYKGFLPGGGPVESMRPAAGAPEILAHPAPGFQGRRRGHPLEREEGRDLSDRSDRRQRDLRPLRRVQDLQTR